MFVETQFKVEMNQEKGSESGSIIILLLYKRSFSLGAWGLSSLWC
jgi:hypothetical protein